MEYFTHSSHHIFTAFRQILQEGRLEREVQPSKAPLKTALWDCKITASSRFPPQTCSAYMARKCCDFPCAIPAHLLELGHISQASPPVVKQRWARSGPY